MSLRVLLTNDDGVDAPGIDALYDELTSVADVTVVAPAEDQSGVGRSNSHTVEVDEYERGLVVHGTPSDCVAVGLGTLDVEPHIVVAGCNDGPNFGAHKLDRSGTVGAAKEAVFLGVPGIAVSAYDPDDGVPPRFEREDFAQAARVTRSLVERANAVDPGTYLNVNAPIGDGTPRVRLTRPARDFDVRIEETGEDGETLALIDRFYDPLRTDRPESMDDPVGTDRRALAEGEISISPLGVDHEVRDEETVSGVLGALRGR
ncbi:5'/3'-nucleotidase SurE [Haladaptatus sp. DYF46]|uniref:5'/3'-nucleotidase SurE n=1 Tax=Haladaptatus sp. DYF46 TaxID=2886041 RepID=UPI001E57A8AF